MSPLPQFGLKGIAFGRREKAWTLAFVAVVLGVVGYRSVIAPRMDAADDARSRWVRTDNELTRLQASRPDVEGQRAAVDALRGQVATLYQELEGLEEGLLNRQDLDLLLQQLVAERQRYQLQINAVKPLKEEPVKGAAAPAVKDAKEAKEGAGQPTFYRGYQVQLDVLTTFDHLINYIRSLDAQRPYQRVTAVKVKIEGQEMVKPHSLILLETLLADAPEKIAKRRQEIFAMTESVTQQAERDPFLPREKPKEEQVAVGLELSGVFGIGADTAALINGEAYRVGETVQGKRVVAIFPDRVVLEQGAKRFLLYPRRENS